MNHRLDRQHHQQSKSELNYFIRKTKIYNSFHFRRYHDKSESSKTSTSSISDKKVTISSTTSSIATLPSTIVSKNQTKQPSTNQNNKIIVNKKIDLGAASNYGKNIGINSPTHQNSHSEDLFSPNNNTSAIKKQHNDLLEDIFSSAESPSTPSSKGGAIIDDFNPRAEEIQEFGDFASALNSNSSSSSGLTSSNKPDLIEDEFADFASAFTGANPPLSLSLNVENSTNLFGESNIGGSSSAETAGLDLFGGPSIHSIMSGGGGASSIPISSGLTTNDLLSDFGDLNLTPSINHGELTLVLIN